MGYIDLHVHSNASDGTLSPFQVVELAVSQGLDAIALTDHDTAAGIPEAKEAARRLGIQLVPGIEFSCTWRGKEIHILGLFIREGEPDFAAAVEALFHVRIRRNEEMLRRFQADNLSITEEELREGNPDTVITRAHFARALVRKGYASSLDQAFQKYLTYGGRYCIPKETVLPEQIMKILKKNGAFSSLAHVMQYQFGWAETEELIGALKELGLSGLEVYHPSHHPGQRQKLSLLARKYGLLPTGGSDFHGANKPDIQIGRGRGGLRVSHCLLEDIQDFQEHSIRSHMPNAPVGHVPI